MQLWLVQGTKAQEYSDEYLEQLAKQIVQLNNTPFQLLLQGHSLQGRQITK